MSMALGYPIWANEHFGPDFRSPVGVNDTMGLICILHGQYSIVNFIPITEDLS